MSRIDQIEAVFHEALALAPGADMAAWLRGRCGEDAELSREVSSLLAARARIPSPMSGLHAAPDQPPLEADHQPEVPPPPSRSDRLGAYRLEEVIGSGGMGAVYRARREDGEFDQKVAIKVMGRHLAGPMFLESFRNERQLLAGLNHPNITRLLDGGVSVDGEPYLVMEYVEGEPIDEYCHRLKLSAAQRLGLFQQVCRAVEYLHRNLIVHRDLKPANILVDREGTVKLLDFGTAKLLREQGSSVTQARLLTPRYASPEQLRGEPFTTVSDVFSLGVLAYELLTGAWPFGNPDSAVDELDRVLRGRRPSLPAAVVTASAAEERSVSRDRLQRELSGDLSTIVLKMLETEPARRYGSAREVEEDLERYREGRPILARPLTAWYAARKFVGRHWLGVSAASATVAALAGLTAFSVYQSIEARNQAARAKRISEFAKNTFFSASSTWSSPLRGQSRAIQVSDILDNAVERAGKELGSDPVAEADLRGTLGMTYAMLGNPVKGEAQIRLAIARLAATPERSSRLAADLQDRLCNALSYEGRYLEALDACHSATALARVYGSAYGLRGVLHDTAFMTVKSGAPFEDAEKLFREALDAPAADADAEAKLTPALVGTRIGSLRLRLGDLVEGNRMLSDAERILRSTPGPPIEIIPTLSALAYGARVKGDYARAVRFLDESVRLLTERPTPYMGIESIELDLAAAEALAGNEESALARLKRLNVESILADSSPVDRIHTETAAGIAEARCGQTDSAERRLRSALEISKKDAARQPGDRVEIYLRLAQLLTANGKTEEAGEVASQGLRDAEIAYGPFFARHPFVKQLREVHP